MNARRRTRRRWRLGFRRDIHLGVIVWHYGIHGYTSYSVHLLIATWNSVRGWRFRGPLGFFLQERVNRSRESRSSRSVNSRRESRPAAPDDSGVVRPRSRRRPGAARRRASRERCGARWDGGAPCALTAGHRDPLHQPADGGAPWAPTADLSRPWWHR